MVFTEKVAGGILKLYFTHLDSYWVEVFKRERLLIWRLVCARASGAKHFSVLEKLPLFLFYSGFPQASIDCNNIHF